MVFDNGINVLSMQIGQSWSGLSRASLYIIVPKPGPCILDASVYIAIDKLGLKALTGCFGLHKYVFTY